MRTLPPSVQPESLSPCRNAATYRCPAGWLSDKWMSTPTRRTPSRCCARLTTGHAAALPSPAMNSRLLNDLICGRQQRFRDGESERLGGLEVDNEFELGRKLDRQVSRRSAAQDAIHVCRR